ncbi:hypothetical protein GCM10023213_08770 [Prosthecobacter algae]|uniref:Uncharacterized protein n=1 Tax=Prosthecobacter algae TaxID=1144682 RepID=A0ABP9NW02_9BACT
MRRNNLNALNAEGLSSHISSGSFGFQQQHHIRLACGQKSQGAGMGYFHLIPRLQLMHTTSDARTGLPEREDDGSILGKTGLKGEAARFQAQQMCLYTVVLEQAAVGVVAKIKGPSHAPDIALSCAGCCGANARL